MRSLRLLRLTGVLFGALSLAPSARAWVFYGKPGAAQVIDGTTGEPIVGVIVEAVWEITNFRNPKGPPLAEMLDLDTTTDLSGQFFFPAWGPLEVDLVSHIRSVVKVLDYSQPHLHLFKPGYRYAEIRGPSEDPRPFLSQFHFKAEDTRDAWWDGRVIALEPDTVAVELHVAICLARYQRLPIADGCRCRE